MAGLYALFGQRKCRYEGEYAPELLEACDENTMSDNPEYMEEKHREHELSGEFTAVRLFRFLYNGKTLEECFQPEEIAADIEPVTPTDNK